jgi:hypothetical protein
MVLQVQLARLLYFLVGLQLHAFQGCLERLELYLRDGVVCLHLGLVDFLLQESDLLSHSLDNFRLLVELLLEEILIGSEHLDLVLVFNLLRLGDCILLE